MAEKLDPKEIVTLEELAISNTWGIAALVELLERKGVLSKGDYVRLDLALPGRVFVPAQQPQEPGHLR